MGFKLWLIIAALCLSLTLKGQGLNIGLHINPTFTTPLEGVSIHDDQIHLLPVSFDYNFGADVNVVFRSLRIETGVNIVHKHIGFLQHTIASGGDVFAKDVFKVVGVEIPVLLDVKLLSDIGSHHDELYWVVGASAEMDRLTSRTSTTGGNGQGISLEHPLADAPFGQNLHYANIITGFHINTIVPHVGLLDYGIAWHMALQGSGPYSVSSTITTGTGSARYSGIFYPRMAYLNIKIAWYFLNYDRHMQRNRAQVL